MVTEESIAEDLTALPPNIQPTAKYFVGFYSENRLVAILDLIDGYPEDKIAFIGLFMTDIDTQGRGIGCMGQGQSPIRAFLDKKCFFAFKGEHQPRCRACDSGRTNIVMKKSHIPIEEYYNIGEHVNINSVYTGATE